MKLLIVVPVYNEELVLEDSINSIVKYCSKNLIVNWSIVIADNASIDNTKDVAKKIVKKNNKIKYLYLSKKGRGRALKKAWTSFKSDIYMYMDVDLATDLNSIKRVIKEFENGSDIVIGNRYDKDSRTNRTIFRLTLSRVYNLMVKIFFWNKISDYQCGFKAVNNNVVDDVIKNLNDTQWFFDTELLLVANKKGKIISQIPVKWNEQGETKVNFFSIVLNYIVKLLKLRIRFVLSKDL